jgi:hypothetical protein
MIGIDAPVVQRKNAGPSIRKPEFNSQQEYQMARPSDEDGAVG